MKLKNIQKTLTFGIWAGFIFGLVKALGMICSNKYFHYRLYRLILFELTGGINKGMLYGFILGVLLVLLIIMLSFILRKFLSAFFEIKVIRKSQLTPLFGGVSCLLLFAYLASRIVKFSRVPNQDPKSLLVPSLVAFLLFFLLIKVEKIYSALRSSRLFGFIRRAGMKTTTGFVLSIFLLLNIFTASQNFFVRPSGPNILLVVADALRPDHLGCYGYDRPTSPYIDKFAAESVVFENTMSNSPWTKPSMGSILTSLYPHEHQAFYWIDNLANRCLTLAEVLRNRNYATFAIQTNPSITKKHNFKQGFQGYEEMIEVRGEAVTSSFITKLDKKKNVPFLAYLHYMDTHVPYNAPQEFSQIFGLKNSSPLSPGKFKTFDVRMLSEIGLSPDEKDQLINLYDGAVKYFDHNFERIMAHLNKLGILDKTIIILTSDHGEEFWEHNGFAHGHSLYREVAQVPLIVKYSSKLPSRRIKSCVQLLDLFPTILSMAGVKGDFSYRGKNLVPSIFKNKEPNEEIFIEGILFGPEKRGLLKGGWKLIEKTKEKNEGALELLGDVTKYVYPEYKEGYELYNINQDLSEKNNLIDVFPQIAIDLNSDLMRLRTSFSFSAQQKRTKLKEKLEDLKTLGYIK